MIGPPRLRAFWESFMRAATPPRRRGLSQSKLFRAKYRRHLWNRSAVVTWFGGAVVDACQVAHDRLAPTERSAPRLRHVELMTESRQFAAGVFRNERFDADITALETSFREPAGFQRFLNVETEIGDVR